MSNDAKLGLVVGVAVVLAIAVVFFHKEGSPSVPLASEAAAAAVSAPKPGPSAPSQRLSRPVKARPTLQEESRQ